MSALAEHAWKDHHFIRWKEATVVDTTRHPGELPLKEALHIHMTPAEERLNRNTGFDIHGCWMVALWQQETRAKLHFPVTPADEPCTYHSDTKSQV